MVSKLSGSTITWIIGLDEMGIFQENSESDSVLALFKQEADLDLSQVRDVTLVASLLKKQLSSLRPPLLSFDGDTYSEIISAIGTSHKHAKN
jgi:hypothetical protein